MKRLSDQRPDTPPKVSECSEQDTPPALAKPSGIGGRMHRLEDERFVTGRASFIDDVRLPGMLHAAVVRSTHAHARIRTISVEAACDLPGVRLVLTADDLPPAGLATIPLDLPPPGSTLEDLAEFAQPVLAGTKVRYVGEPVAFIVAETRQQAQDAIEAVDVDYEDLPACTRLDAADAARKRDDGGASTMFRFAVGDADATTMAFDRAARTVSVALHNNRVHALPLEPRGAIGQHDPSSDRFTLLVGTQRVHIIQRALADRVFRVPRERMRVVAPDTGGGFGQKNGLYPEYVLCLEAARRLSRPVKWISGRGESFAADNHGRGNLFVAEAALDRGGIIAAVRVRRRVDLGAYTAPRAMVTVGNGLSHLTGVYRIGAADVRVEGVRTNTVPVCPYRGAGRPENIYCCERLMDIVARQLGLDPIDFRRRNLVPESAMPWDSPLGTPFAAAPIAATLEDALARIDHAGFPQRREHAARRGRMAGLGVALFAEDLHGSQEPLTVRLELREQRLTLLTGTGSAGHGHETAFRQIASQTLHLPAEEIGFLQSDTSAMPDGIGTAASWSVTLGGSSVQLAAQAAVERGKGVAAALLDVPPEEMVFQDGLFRGTGTNRTAGWTEVFAADPSFAATGTFRGDGRTVSIGCHACEVEVDPETGEVKLARAAIAQDCGLAVNPLLVEGQLHGGFAQGIGQAWMEGIVYDADSGQLISGELTDYALARASDLPPIATAIRQHPAPDNPLGVKGIGESAAAGSAPAFVNAVMDALAPLGIQDIAPPLSPQAVRAAIAQAPGSGVS